MTRVGTGASVAITGELVESPGKGQKWEVRGKTLEVIGEADQETFPLQKKRHSDEFLRSIAHLRPRTNKFGAMFRMRSKLAQAVHKFFAGQGFLLHPYADHHRLRLRGCGRDVPCDLPGGRQQRACGKRFLRKPSSLTVSGQLSVEMFALSLGDCYTFGPTFRAENSNTPRHVAEFWMIEPKSPLPT